MSKETALVIIDVQEAVFEYEGSRVYRYDETLNCINDLLSKARATNTSVIYVQHEEENGPLQAGTPGWQIHPAIAPHEGEPVIHKTAPDSFYNTTLDEELRQKGIKHLVVAGAATDFCVNTTVRRATTMGYDVTLVGDAHTTMDNSILSGEQAVKYHNAILDGFGTPEHMIQVKATHEIEFS